MSVGETVVSMEKVSYVELDGFVVDCARETAIVASSGGYRKYVICVYTYMQLHVKQPVTLEKKYNRWT